MTKQKTPYVQIATDDFTKTIVSASLRGYFDTSDSYERDTPGLLRAREYVKQAIKDLLSNKKTKHHLCRISECKNISSVLLEGFGWVCSDHANPENWPKFCESGTCIKNPIHKTEYGLFCDEHKDIKIRRKCHYCNNTYAIRKGSDYYCINHGQKNNIICSHFDKEKDKFCYNEVSIILDRVGFCEEHKPTSMRNL